MYKTVPYLTKYEMSRVVGIRAAQLAHGAPSEVASRPHDRIEQALDELRSRKLHAFIERPITSFGKQTERIHLNELSFEAVPGISPDFVNPRYEVPMVIPATYEESYEGPACELTVHCVIPPWELHLDNECIRKRLQEQVASRPVVLKTRDGGKAYGIVMRVVKFETDPVATLAMTNGCARLRCQLVATVKCFAEGDRENVVCVQCTPSNGEFEVEASIRDCVVVKFIAHSSTNIPPTTDMTVRIKQVAKNARGQLICTCDDIS